MQRGSMRVLFVIVLLSALMAPMAAQASPHHQDTGKLTATVDIVHRGVQLMKSGTKRWLNITIESVLEVGDRVRTNDTGIALITWFANGTSMQLGPNTEIVVEELSGNQDTFAIQTTLIQGTIFNNIQSLLDPASRYEILTPGLSATVRGTVFGVTVDEEFNTGVAVTIGTVGITSVANPDEEISLEEGNFLSSDLDGKVSKAVALDKVPDAYTDFISALQDYDQSVSDTRTNSSGSSSDNSTGANVDSGATGNNSRPDTSNNSSNRADQANQNANNTSKTNNGNNK